MTRYIADYFWRNGAPCAVKYCSATDFLSYKIVADPYNKHISIEKYVESKFAAVVYDSALLDFRQLHPHSQTAWQRIIIEEQESMVKALLVDHNDRVRFYEHCYFQEGLCLQCQIFSLHSALLSTHRIFYTDKGDSFNGVELYDSNEHIVMRKSYAASNDAYIFGELLEENWCMKILSV